MAGVIAGTLIGAIAVGATTTPANGLILGTTLSLYFVAVIVTRKWATLGYISRRTSYAVNLIGAAAVALVLFIAAA